MAESLRARLEATQARAAALRLETASLPEQSARQVAVTAQVEEARRGVQQEELKALDVHRAELEELARQEPKDEVRGRWWMADGAPLVLLFGMYVAFRLAWSALDVVSWPQFGKQWQWYVAAVPLVVNGLRVARGAWRRRRASKRPS